MSVTILTPGTFPIPAPISSSVEASIVELAPHLSKNIDLTILGKKFKNTTNESKLQGVHYVNFTSFSIKNYLKQAVDYLKEHPTTIIQVENRPQYISYIKEKLPNSTVWLGLHSTTFLHPKLISPQNLLQALGIVDRIIVNSHALKNKILKYNPNWRNKVIVNHLGVDIERFLPRDHPKLRIRKEKVRNQLNLKTQKVILFVGRLIPMKGVHHLLKTIPYLQKRETNFKVVIVGGNKYGRNQQTPYVKQLLQYKKKYPKQVQFIPYVPNHHIHEWYSIADILVTPSIGFEALGLVNLEAMSSALPVIGTKIGGIPEVIRHNQTGLLVPLRDHTKQLAKAIATLLHNPNYAKQLGQNGRKLVERQFTWKSSAHRLYQYYLKERA